MQKINIGAAGKLYRSAMPYSQFDPLGELIKKYHYNNIDYIILLTDKDEYKKISGRDLKYEYRRDGFEVIHYPMVDFGIPTNMKTFISLVETIILLLNKNKNILVHCHAGLSRTILVMNCIQIRLGKTVEEAVSFIISEVPQCIITEEQINFLRLYQEQTDKGEFI